MVILVGSSDGSRHCTEPSAQSDIISLPETASGGRMTRGAAVPGKVRAHHESKHIVGLDTHAQV